MAENTVCKACGIDLDKTSDSSFKDYPTLPNLPRAFLCSVCANSYHMGGQAMRKMLAEAGGRFTPHNDDDIITQIVLSTHIILNQIKGRQETPNAQG